MNGFYIKRLLVRNENECAGIVLRPGANLITGASDTGKSYIFSAINHGLGRSDEPKDIIESTNFKDIFIEISTFENGDIYCLHRKIGNKEITISKATFENFSKGNPSKYTTTGPVDNPKNISSFLLSLAGLPEKRLLKNRAKGITQNLSIKNIMSLTFVNETNIIKETSPYYFSSQYSDRILAQSLLHLILTGEDFADVLEVEDQADKETRIRGKLEFLVAQISQFAVYKDSLVEESEHSVGDSERTRFLALDNELKSNVQEAKALTEGKNELIARKEAYLHESRNNRDLLNRFRILEKQYISDSERLNFILEAKVLSDQLGDTVCPLCSSPLGEDHISHIREKEGFQAAALEELEKNTSKLSGLRRSISDVKIDQETVIQELETINLGLLELERQISDNFSTKIQSIKTDLKEYMSVENIHSEIRFVEKQLTKLFLEKNRLEAALKSKEPYDQVTILSYTLLSNLSEKIKERLQKWNYEAHVDVNFNSEYEIFDIVISGKSRRSYGKGKRAIAYAACLIGMLDVCREKNLPFTNLILMDSPLTTYEEKKRKATIKKDLLQREVIQSFFLDIADIPSDRQLIILDNKEPDTTTLETIGDRLNIIQFTGDEGFGRAGFFPTIHTEE